MNLRPDRFAPDAAQLPAHLEYCHWRPARFPATSRSWRVRRWIARRIEAFAVGIHWCAAAFLLGERLIRNFAELVHGQPRVAQRLNWSGLPPRRVNRFEPLVAPPAAEPYTESDLDFLADYCRAIPEALAALSPQLRAAVIARRHGVVSFGGGGAT